jgi:rod shape-determining protein MreC
MILSALGLRAIGLRRNNPLFIFITRFFARSASSVNKIVMICAFVFVSVYLLFSAKLDSPLTHHLQNFLMDCSTPVVSVLNRPLEIIASWKNYFRNQQFLQEENNLLKEQNANLLHWRWLAQEREHENHRLREILNVVPDLKRSTVTVRALGVPSDRYYSSLIVLVTNADGVRKDQAVISPMGIIGRIIDVGSATARVMLITDINSRIPVRFESSGEQAIIAGNNSLNLKVVHLESNADKTQLKASKIKIGEKLLTSGYGGIFLPNMPVAIVTSIEANTIIACPLVDVTRLEFVTILGNEIENHAQQ